MRSTVSGTSLARNMHPSAVSDHSRYQHEACLPQKQFSPGIWPSSLWWPLFLQLVTARQERGGRGEMCRRSIGFPHAAVSCMAQSRILECRDPAASPLLADAITHGQPATNFLTACLGHVPCFFSRLRCTRGHGLPVVRPPSLGARRHCQTWVPRHKPHRIHPL
jgi:hypothetical protein